MPIGRFPDWDACIAWAREHDIGSPEAYCGELERQATQGSNMTHVALVAPEGVRTSDRRLINPGALSWREGAPLMFIDKTTEGHDEAQHVGNLSNFRRTTVDGETWLVADLQYDSDEQAREAQRLADEGKIAGVSADIGAVTADLEILEVDDDGMPTDWLETISEGEVLGATQLPMPAFAGARIMSTLDFQALTTETESMVAAALSHLDDWLPPRELFEVEEPDHPQAITVYQQGEFRGFYGHAAMDWSQCHLGISDRCIPPPYSPSDGGEFNTRALSLSDGSTILVGPVTMATDADGGHEYNMKAGADATRQHYDNANTVIGVGVMSNGAFGPWVCGAILPDVTAAQLTRFKLQQFSGDWRQVDGQLDMVACLAVPKGGFGVKARIASGEVVSMIASGPPPDERSRDDLIYEALRLLTDKIDALVVKDGPHRSEGHQAARDSMLLDLAEHGRIAAILDATG